MHSAILAVLPASVEGIEFRELPGLVEGKISKLDLEKLDLVSWYTTIVKLDMEVRGELERVPGSKHQRLQRSMN